MGDTTTSVLTAANITRTFNTQAGEVQALRGVTLDIQPGQLVVVSGRSGSGKTTLLNLLGALDLPTTGTVNIAGTDTQSVDDTTLANLRRDNIGFIFQTFGLIPVLSARENIEVPLRVQKVSASERKERVEEILELVGLSQHGEQRPYELSGGQQQRVGIARALVTRPNLLIGDEPTGQLDSKTAASITKLILQLLRSQDTSAVLSTHDPKLIALADVHIALLDGKAL